MFSDNVKNLMQFIPEGYEDLKKVGEEMDSNFERSHRIYSSNSLDVDRSMDAFEVNSRAFENLDLDLQDKIEASLDTYGLILNGGGGKGAYQIGAIKALAEISDLKFGAVAGTSVGALNAALFAAGSYEKAYDIWTQIDPEDVLTPKEMTDSQLDQINQAQGSIDPRFSEEQIKDFIISEILGKHTKFSRNGLKKIIRDSNISSNLGMDKLLCSITCFDCKDYRPKNFLLNKLTPEDIEDGLLASSCMPFVYDPVRFMDGDYYDGGYPFFGNNLPLSPLYNIGFRNFIVIHLASRNECKKDINMIRLNRKNLKESFYNGAKYIHIFPSWDLGDLFDGTLNFHREYASELIKRGYDEVKIQTPKIKEDIKKTGFDGYNDQFSEMHCLDGQYFKSYDDLLDSL